ncbi:MAG: hypothetical protein JF606_25280 [Burkholderiales bacterium]|jgi:hypothetical protein|nr:hypothetical protein [Burkholderiales bacterium]
MSEPRKLREAMMAQVAGELDEILKRVELAAPMLASANECLATNAAALKTALEQYRSTVAGLSGEAMRSIAEFAVRRTNEAAVHSTEQQQALIQACARQAFETELVPHLRALKEIAAGSPQEPARPFWSTWVEHAATATATALVTAAGVLYLVR